MGMDVRPARNGLYRASDGPAVFDYRFFLGEVPHRDLVAERNIVQELYFSGSFAFQRNCADGGAFFQIHDGDANVVLGFMQ